MITRILGIAICIALLTGCNNDQRLSRSPDHLSGKDLFEMHCVECHKDSGSGNFLKGIPSIAQTRMSKEAISQQIFEGKNKMPSHPKLTYAQRLKLAGYIKKELR